MNKTLSEICLPIGMPPGQGGPSQHRGPNPQGEAFKDIRNVAVLNKDFLEVKRHRIRRFGDQPI